jgi:hypothetical protein
MIVNSEIKEDEDVEEYGKICYVESDLIKKYEKH